MSIRGAVAAPILAIDVNDRSNNTTANTQSGYAVYVMTGSTLASSAAETDSGISYNSGTYSVTMQAVDDHQDENTTTTGLQDTTGQIDDRLRATPANTSTLTNSAIYDDVIFANTGCGPTGGIDVHVSGTGLAANTQYLVSIYDFDTGSQSTPLPRNANWYDGNNSGALVLSASFSNQAAVNNSDYEFSGLAMTDSSGVLYLQGRNANTKVSATGAVQPGVFINGFEIAAAPEPASLGLIAMGGLLIGRRRNRK
jgi:hypothetical protein